MPALKVISLNDSVPKSVAFTPTQVDRNGVAQFRAPGPDGRPIGFKTLTSSIKDPGTSGDVYRTRIHLNLPDVATVTVPGSTGSTIEVTRMNRAHVEFILPVQSLPLVREDLLALLISALQDTDFKSTVVGLEHFY